MPRSMQKKNRLDEAACALVVIEVAYGWYGGKTMVLDTRTLKRYPGRIFSVGAIFRFF